MLSLKNSIPKCLSNLSSSGMFISDAFYLANFMISSFAGKFKSLYSSKFILSLEMKYEIDEYLDLGI